MKINRSTPVRELMAPEEPEASEVKEAAKRRQDGFVTDDTLHQWWRDHNRTPESDVSHRNKILDELKGFRHQAINAAKLNAVPKSKKTQVAYKEMIGAIDSWDEKKGASLRTHVYGRLFPTGNKNYSVVNKALHRYSEDGKSITPGRAKIISKARELIQEFEMENGRRPSDNEISDMLKLPIKEVRKLKQNLQSSHTIEFQIDDTFAKQGPLTPQMKDALNTVYRGLTGNDKRVLQMIAYPHLGGSMPTGRTQKDYARTLGISQTDFTNIKTKILGLIDEAV